MQISSRVLALAIVLLALLGGKSEAANSRATPPANECLEVTTEIAKLRSHKKIVRNQTKERIVLLSQNSDQLRQCVVRSMSDIVRTPRIFSDPALFFKYPELYEAWNGAVNVLARIRAVETIPILIDCIDCNDGPSTLGIGLYPAARALVRFGEAAIPSLESALTNSPPEIRRMIVTVLRDIGGETAEAVLTRRLKVEDDEFVASSIKNMLANWREFKRR